MSRQRLGRVKGTDKVLRATTTFETGADCHANGSGASNKSMKMTECT